MLSKPFLIVLLLGAMQLIPLQSAFSCDCPAQPSFDDALAKSSVVFLGRVEEIGTSGYKKGFVQIKLFAIKKFKGFEELPTNDIVVMYTPAGQEQCGYKFQNGFEYIIYATGNPAFLQTGACSRTEVLEKAQLDEQRLLRLSTANR